MAILEDLQSLIQTSLILDSPVLSGNMQNHIQYEGYYNNDWTMSISGPSYDMKEWEKSHRFIYTNEYDYAVSVNKLGAFGGRSTKSKHWANKSIVNAAQIIASQYGAELVVEVEL